MKMKREMSLEVRLISFLDLRGKSDRYAVAHFRGVSETSNVLQNCSGEAFFNKDFYWLLETPIEGDEWLELRLFDRNKVLKDRLVGVYRLCLAAIVDRGCAEVRDNLIDQNNQILKSEIHMEVKYTKPDPRGNQLIQGLESESGADEVDLLQDKGLRHPKILHPPVVHTRHSDWTIKVRIIEAKDLAGVSLDPSVNVTVGDQKEQTEVKKQTNNPSWDELFVFEYKCPEQEVLDKILLVEVFTGRNLIIEGTLIGAFKCDMWYVYDQIDHSFFSKWAPLYDTLSSEIKGYVRLDLQIFGKGDIVKEPPSRKEDLEIDQNLILPSTKNLYRSVHQYRIKIFKAEGIPQMNTAFMASMKKTFTKKNQDMADPFVEVSFGGVSATTSTKKNTYKPEFNQLISFSEFFPSLCRRIKIQLKDSDITSNEVIGTHFIDLNEISSEGESNRRGFMPTFGPSWVNLYGSTRDYALNDEHQDLNNGVGEGVAYRGRILIWLDCTDDESNNIGNVIVKDCDPLPPESTGNEDEYLLFGTFYEANMIPKKIGEKPVSFEMTIGEYGYLMKDHDLDKEDFQDHLVGNLEEIDKEEVYNHEKIFIRSLTKPIKPITPDRKYLQVPFGNEKPCVHIKFPFVDQRRRHYNSILLLKIWITLEENLDDIDENARLHTKGFHRNLKQVMADIIRKCSLYNELSDGRKTSTHLGINQLDIVRTKMALLKIKDISKMASEIKQGCLENDKLDKLAKLAHNLLRQIENLLNEPQHGLPDIFIWMLSNGKRVAYTRIPANDILHSPVTSEKGIRCGRMQTIFLRLPGKKGHGENGWKIQAKLEVSFWLGLMKHNEELKDVPSGFEEKDTFSRFVHPPDILHYTKKQYFIVRSHIYQARSLIGSDDNGLSDAFCRCVVMNQSKDTFAVYSTRSPTWDMTMKFVDIELWGDASEFAVNPPIIVLELFDKDIGGGEEFLGRALVKPVVKLATERYQKPFFPPNLQWFSVYRGRTKAGGILGAFEMLQVPEERMLMASRGDLMPVDPVKCKGPGNFGMFMRIPDDIRPIKRKHRIEVLFWGVRNLKKMQLISANRPQVELDCCYPMTKQTGEDVHVVKSVILKNAKKNPNFESVAIFDVWLPERVEYLPPINIYIKDNRAFGRQVLCGTHVIDSLYRYFMDPTLFNPRLPLEAERIRKKNKDSEEMDIDPPPESPPEETTTKKKIDDCKKGDEEEEALDWWTRFYETLRSPGNIECMEKEKSGDNDVMENDERAKIPILKIFDDSLENVEDFGGFKDFIMSFNLFRGKALEDDYEMKRFSGTFKGNIRVWKYPLPLCFDTEDKMGTFYKLPNKPFNVLVRVYVVRCLNLHPMDRRGKADPYLICSLGKKTFNDKDKYVSKQICPEFGRCFEFTAVIPFDTVVHLEVMDWDMFTANDLIGETFIDIENRFYSKHRPSCGLQKNYISHGYAKWRDPQRPTSILSKLCKEHQLDGPYFNNGTVKVNDQQWTAEPFIINAKGKKKMCNEPAALEALLNFDKLKPKGFPLVPEHIETRTLYNPEKPGVNMGKVQMWIDMFPMDSTMPGEPVNIEVRKLTEYELRVIIWNTSDVLPDETDLVTGEKSSDQFIKGWLEGNREDIQETDVHYRSLDGSGIFNWRFIFPFKYHKAKKKIVTKKKANLFAMDLTEEKHKSLLYLQVWDADLFSSDDFIGDLILPLSKLPCPAKVAKQCNLGILESGPTASIFKIKHCRGWWPFQVNPEDDDDPNPILAGKVEAEIELKTKEEAEAEPVGKKREAPQPLEKPNRPNDSFFMGPLAMLRGLMWRYKWFLLKALIVIILLLVLVLFLYSIPGYTIKKVFGA